LGWVSLGAGCSVSEYDSLGIEHDNHANLGCFRRNHFWANGVHWRLMSCRLIRVFRGFERGHDDGREEAIRRRDTQMKRIWTVTSGALLALFLSGCGGSGGGGTPALPPPPPATGTINTGSVLTVAGRSVNAGLQSGSFGGITDFVGLTTVASNNKNNLLSEKPANFGGRNIVSQVPVGPEITPCAVDGSLTVSGDISSALTVTAGDFLDYEWDSCDDGLGQVIDGLLGMTFTEFSGDLLAGRILLGVSLTAGNFRVTEGADFNHANGGLTLTIDSRTQPNTTITTVGSSFTIGDSGSTETLTNFSNTVTENTSTFPSNFTTDVTGTVSSTQFDGSVNYNTTVPFQSTGSDYPYTGEMLVTGSDNARIQIIAISAVSVRIIADYNGDGAPDATIDTTWDALVSG